MRLFLILVFCTLAFVAQPAHAATCPSSAKCPGNLCDHLGLSTMSDDQVNIVYCTTNTASNTPPLVWKSSVSDLTCPAGEAVTGIVNGVPQCAAINLNFPCPSGYVVIGISNGNPVCASAP